MTREQAAPYLERALLEEVFQRAALAFMGCEWPPKEPPREPRKAEPGGPCGGSKLAACRAEWGGLIEYQCAMCAG